MGGGNVGIVITVGVNVGVGLPVTIETPVHTHMQPVHSKPVEHNVLSHASPDSTRLLPHTGGVVTGGGMLQRLGEPVHV